jgi:hypothetical protein
MCLGSPIDELYKGIISGELEGEGLLELLMQKAKLLIAQEALEKEVESVNITKETKPNLRSKGIAMAMSLRK